MLNQTGRVLWVAGAICLGLASEAGAEAEERERELIGPSIRGGVARLVDGFGRDFETGGFGEFALTVQRGRIGADFFLAVQENGATSGYDAEESARIGQPTRVTHSMGGGGLRLRAFYPGPLTFASAYGEAGAGLHFSWRTREYGGSRKDEPTRFGAEGCVGAGLNVHVLSHLSLMLGGELRQAYTNDGPKAAADLGIRIFAWP